MVLYAPVIIALAARRRAVTDAFSKSSGQVLIWHPDQKSVLLNLILPSGGFGA
jgi:hypothetical protein